MPAARRAYAGGVTERLALFPLRTVLYPGLVLPLHVFEERYRELVRDLVELPEDATKEFGVVAIRRGREAGTEDAPDLFEVGCTAAVRRIGSYPDGRFDLTTAGARRFRLRSTDTTLHSYTTGEVEWIDEPDGEDPEPWAVRVTDRFHAYQARIVGDDRADAQEVPEDPIVVSYLVSAAMVLDLDEKQQLLAAPDTTARLRLLSSLLRRETLLIEALGALPAADLLRDQG